MRTTASGSGSKTYTVRSGDNLTKIAKKNGVSLKSVISSNKQIKNPDLIHPGQKISIPDNPQRRGANQPPPDGRNGGLSSSTLRSRLESRSGVDPNASGTRSGPAPNSSANNKAQGSAKKFLDAALAQKGDRYVYGAETRMSDKNPKKFDCSELVEWAAHQAGVKVPDGSANQLDFVRRNGKQLSVQEAIRTPGALLFKPGHVAISLGDGRTIEARSSKLGVDIFSASGRGFTSGGLIPGMSYN